MLWPPAQAKVYNAALPLKRLATLVLWAFTVMKNFFDYMLSLTSSMTLTQTKSGLYSNHQATPALSL